MIFLAGVLLCLHTLLPHVHAELNEFAEAPSLSERPTHQQSFLELLSELISGNLGQEHLENFTPEPAEQLIAVSSCLAELPLVLHLSDCAAEPIQSVNPPDTSFLFSSIEWLTQSPLRGPPVLA